MNLLLLLLLFYVGNPVDPIVFILELLFRF
jgi:hypothetical protein